MNVNDDFGFGKARSRRRKEAEVWAIVVENPPPHVGGYAATGIVA